MSFLTKFSLRLLIGLVALAVTMIASPWGGRTLGEFPLWVIAWVSSMVSYLALAGPICGIAEAAKEAKEEKEEKDKYE